MNVKIANKGIICSSKTNVQRLMLYKIVIYMKQICNKKVYVKNVNRVII